MKQLYQCTNSSCPLGDVSNPGHFTGGMSQAQRSLLTGDPEPPEEDYGEGICPNCGTAGKKVEPQGDPREEVTS